MLRRALGRGVLAQLEGGSSGMASSSSMCALAQQLQQTAGFAKKTESVDGRLQKVMRMLESQEVETVEVSEEDYLEGMRRAKEYSRRKMQEHRDWQADLTLKLKLKNAAVAALPPHLRAAAEVPDLEPFPLNRQMWTETPPIEGFGQAAATTQRAGAKKIGTKHHR
ncbi:hypothetical protein ABPG75_013436 [Micractinium tetrahymenae]